MDCAAYLAGLWAAGEKQKDLAEALGCSVTLVHLAISKFVDCYSPWLRRPTCRQEVIAMALPRFLADRGDKPLFEIPPRTKKKNAHK